ncbi:MAG: hypothetical protein ACI9OJ_003497 [Myxococcota bacterium]
MVVRIARLWAIKTARATNMAMLRFMSLEFAPRAPRRKGAVVLEQWI